MRLSQITALLVLAISPFSFAVAAGTCTGTDRGDGWGCTQAPNVGGITNTRHNLTQSYTRNSISTIMDRGRNDYGEVCVYCHTPHSAATNIGAAPLWNRTKPQATFSVYSAATTLGQPVTQPGPNSLTCLSCHDGATAIDSIVNLPGSGRVGPTAANTPDIALLDAWKAQNNPDLALHANLQQCADGCHGPNSPFIGGPDFTAFVIGADLKNDHPVGILYPTVTGAARGFAEPTRATRIAFFDKDGNNHADSNEIRMYDTGDGYEVECGSCHDPHGVPSAGPGSRFIASFMRVDNRNQSALCLTCHIK